MFSIFPRDKKFHILLEQMAAVAYEAANGLSDLVHGNTAHDEVAAASAIVSAKSRAKAVSMEITKELCRSFITPFDREDIQAIADHLYKIPKITEKIMDRVRLHKLTGKNDDFLPQIDLIKQEAEAMRDIVKELSIKGDAKRILDKVALLHQLEQKGDNVRQDLLSALYSSDRDIRDLLIRRDIYDMLEKVVDRYRDVAGVAMQIVLKNT